MIKNSVSLLLLSSIIIISSGCSSSSSESSSEPEVQWYQPEKTASFHWQLQGSINPSYDVTIYDIDLFDTSPETIASLKAQGKKVICYFSAGSYEGWREDAYLFHDSDLGNDLDWHDERWLDIRSENVRSIMKNRIALAAQKGCDGVEPDNVDGYTNDPGFPLTYKDQIEYNTFLANTAHEYKLSVALKNDLEQINDLVNLFDFSINEQCHHYNECDYMQPFISQGKPVFNVEYDDIYRDSQEALNALCQDSSAREFYTLVLPKALDDSFRISCK
ncbi:MAG: endo alpha-1,4 polygalactosaminidase [Epsilonproteobacteria bacterium]|nr:endo alpha-1,4 polygalactosaminidase [Campylobacterota bacterium]